MDANGVVNEPRLLEALALLLVRHVVGQVTADASLVVDVLSLSLGYYHESSQDDAVTTRVATLMTEFSDAGVLVVAAAGNDSTTEPLLPAGLSLSIGGVGPGLVSVAALNPDGTSVASFSNDGPWVTTYRQGAAVVSTFPTNFDAARQATFETAPDSGRARGSIDMDDFSSGFGVWSGTSFSAPIFAAEIAAALVAAGDLESVEVTAMRKRATSALESVVGAGSS